MIRVVLFFLALCLPASSLAVDLADAVNRIRSDAGLPLLVRSTALDNAARAHTGYLDRHREPGKTAHGLSAHSQQPGLEGFSGETPTARALAAGYPHRDVLENVSMGYADDTSALEGLMGAIYHRLTFLDFEADELGLAVGAKSRVFLLGRGDLSQSCLNPPPGALYRQPLDCLGQPMTRDHYDKLCVALPSEALFRPPHSVRCPNGQQLDAGFVSELCRAPPREALSPGYGYYDAVCDDDTRIDASWFEALCTNPPPEAAYLASGRYFEICAPPRRVSAEWLEQHCTQLPVEARYRDSGRFRKPCGDDRGFRVEYLDELDAAKQRALPTALVWPPPWAIDVPPAFFVEEPDPLPDRDFSGYPVSIQFNPVLVEKVELRRFALYRVGAEGRSLIRKVRLLDVDSDPNDLLSEHEFALFPLARLDWGGRYAVEVEAELDGKPWQSTWQFDVKGADLPVLNVAADRQRFTIRSGVPTLLYLPPREGQAPKALRARTEHLRGNRVVMEAVDPHTLKVLIEARHCDRIVVRFDDGRTVELIPLGC